MDQEPGLRTRVGGEGQGQGGGRRTGTGAVAWPWLVSFSLLSLSLGQDCACHYTHLSLSFSFYVAVCVLLLLYLSLCLPYTQYRTGQGQAGVRGMWLGQGQAYFGLPHFTTCLCDTCACAHTLPSPSLLLPNCSFLPLACSLPCRVSVISPFFLWLVLTGVLSGRQADLDMCGLSTHPLPFPLVSRDRREGQTVVGHFDLCPTFCWSLYGMRTCLVLLVFVVFAKTGVAIPSALQTVCMYIPSIVLLISPTTMPCVQQLALLRFLPISLHRAGREVVLYALGGVLFSCDTSRSASLLSSLRMCRAKHSLCLLSYFATPWMQ